MSVRLLIKQALAGFLLVCVLISLISCFGKETKTVPPSDSVLLGFSQIGAESAWRTCNTQSVIDAAEKRGIQLLFENAEQKQAKQINAIRSFIVYQVDVIAFVPIVADGWDNVLKEAKEAGIPVLITDRKIETSDPSLYAGFIGTDSFKEGREAAWFLQKKFKKLQAEDQGSRPPVRIVELAGTEGASCVIGRGEGFREVLGEDPGFEIVYTQSGDFLRSKGYEIMLHILDEVEDIDVLYSHNDAMALGAMDALKERGIRPGKDMVIVTIDAEQAAIDALRLGQVNCVIECNPKTGPVIIDLAEKLAAREEIPRLIHVEEDVFTEWDNLSGIAPRGY